MLIKNTYEIPYPLTTLADMAEVKTFFDENLLPFFAEKLGLAIRTDLNIMAPDYAPNAYVCFLAPSINSDPYFAICANGTKQFYISPLVKNGNVFQPTGIYNQSSSGIGHTWTYNEMIILQSIASNDYKSYLIMIDFNDGRKIACFRSTNIRTGAFVESTRQGVIYFGPIKMNGNLINNTCAILAAGWNSAWFDEYDQRACKNVLVTRYTISGGNYNVFLPTSSGSGKEFLLTGDYCISNENASLSYIPNVAQYSDCNQALEIGSIITINNKKYVNITKDNKQGSTAYSKTLIPEEVN